MLNFCAMVNNESPFCTVYSRRTNVVVVCGTVVVVVVALVSFPSDSPTLKYADKNESAAKTMVAHNKYMWSGFRRNIEPMLVAHNQR